MSGIKPDLHLTDPLPERQLRRAAFRFVLAFLMSGCPFHSSAPRTSRPAEAAFAPGEQVESELAFLSEAHSDTVLSDRLVACRAALSAGRPAPLSQAELTWAGRIAWRNHARCIGRLYWRALTVRDHRHLDTAGEIAASLREHLALAQGDGAVRSLLTVFAPPGSPGGPAPRIWNHQLCAYAGYRGGGTILGDPKNAELTAHALALGWQPPATRSRFDLLPWIIAGRDGHPKLFPLPPGLVREVPLRHPDLPWFEKLGLRWYAVPVISDMRLHAAGTDYPAAPFNGWYMSTEIGARNLADTGRYNLLPVIAQKLGLDCRRPRTLWQDRALVELNVAVLHSYEADGVKLVDHHTASAEFLKFCEREKSAGRAVSARWDWIVPPMSPATTPVFHTPMHEFQSTPDFHSQLPAWA
ncbi:MAG: Nitric oxide synthase oxygenase [Lacunisphaera sp.]|nr:Nitric oxide synthase oxygenase [Lacunisphaera sp.]